MKQKVQELQRGLYRAAKKDDMRTFYSLHDKIYRWDVLVKAWQQVRANKGVPGVDGKSIEQIETEGLDKFLRQVQIELKEETYRCCKIKRVEIPKAKGGTRKLGIPTIKDRLVQTATRLVIEPIFEADFQDCSYGFRPKRSAKQASLEIYKWLNYGLTQVVDIDLKNYFDSIPHDNLIKIIERRVSDRYVLKLIKAWLRAGTLTGHRPLPATSGAPQGSPISPLLSNIYLNELDKQWMKTMANRNGWNAQMVRYADDLVVLTDKPTSLIKVKLLKYLTELGLAVNEDKSQNTTANQGFNFLGYAYRRGYSPKYQKEVTHMYPTGEAIKRVIKKITILTYRKRLHEPVHEIVKDINQVLLGWTEYYRHTASSRRFRKVQGHANRRLRKFIMKKKHSRKNGYKELPDDKLYTTYRLINVGVYRVKYCWT